jgi:site-specific DNA-cytosine methylase
MLQKINWFTKSRRAQNINDDETWNEGGVSPTLNSFDNGGESRATVLIIDGTRVDDVRIYEDGIVPTVIQRYGTGGGNVPMVFPISGNVIHQATSTVRRLTPLECERLQGFPDGWTDSQSDTNRYKQMGNAVAVPVVEWIIGNIVDLHS